MPANFRRDLIRRLKVKHQMIGGEYYAYRFIVFIKQRWQLSSTTHGNLHHDKPLARKWYSNLAFYEQLAGISRHFRIMSVVHKFRCLLGKIYYHINKNLYSFILLDIANCLKRCWLCMLLQKFEVALVLIPCFVPKCGVSSNLRSCVLYF